MKKENQELRQQLSSTRTSNSNDQQNQIDLLRQMVRTSEETLAKERLQLQRATTKKSDDYGLLNEQIESLKTSERHLKSKVRSLTNEITMLKRK